MRWMLINKVKLLFKTITKHSAHWVLGALFGFRRFCHSVVVFSHLWRDCVETPRSACGCPFRRAELNLPWKGRGTSGAGGGVLCGIFCFMYQISRKHPSVTCGDSFPFRGARWNLPWKGRRTVVRRWRGSCGIFCFMYQISRKHPLSHLRWQLPLSGKLDETSPERGGEPSLDGGGVLCEIFCLI